MGLFGSRKKVYVSSAAYNLAGDIQKRPHYLKTTMVNYVLTGNRRTGISTAIQNALLAGPGISLRSFGRWARTSGYTDSLRIGKTNLSGTFAINMDTVNAYLQAVTGEDVSIQSIEIDDADYSYWAEQWMLENFPEEFDTTWAADYNDIEKKVYIDRAYDAGLTSFYVPQMTRGRKYCYMAYMKPNGDLRIWIYAEGSGSASMDAMFRSGDSVGSFFPPIFVRYDNKFLSNSYKPDLYKLGSKAFEKATGSEITLLVDQLRQNDSLSDIDHAFVVFGASLNSPSTNACRYIFDFFSAMLRDNPTVAAGGNIADYRSALEHTRLSVNQYEIWADTSEGEAPKIVAPPPSPRTSIIYSSNRTDIDFYFKIEWKAMTSTSGSGLAKVGAKPGECWISKGTDFGISKKLFGLGKLSTVISESLQGITITYQESANSWKRLTIQGLKHTNRVYKGKAVEISAWEALDDTEESGFIIPLHESIFREMPLTKATQFATANSYLVLNCYKVVKKKWYQTGIFAVILIVVMIVVSIYFPPAAGAGGGLLGSGAAVGGAIGLSGTAALIAGAAINAIAAMVVINLITKIATEVFGEKIGSIVGAVAAVFVMQVGTAVSNGASMASAFSGLMNPVNLLRLTNAVGQGYQGYLQASTAELMGKTQEVLEDYEGAMGEISSKMYELLGSEQGVVDPLAFLDSTNGTIGAESRDSFLARTLLTGSEIADMSMELITEFTNITLDTSMV